MPHHWDISRSPRPLIFHRRLPVASNLRWKNMVSVTNTIFNRTSRSLLIIFFSLFLDAIRVAIVARNIVNSTSGVSITAFVASKDARKAVWNNFVKPRVLLGRYGDYGKLQGSVSTCSPSWEKLSFGATNLPEKDHTHNRHE